MKVLIMVDSFKGTLTSQDIGNIVSKKLKKDNIKSCILPISDGGEGLLKTISKQKKVFEKSILANNPNFEKIQTRYLFDKDTAYIEMAEINGLNLVKEEHRKPIFLSTYGLGEVIFEAIKKGVVNIVLGLGGSATNDAGAGMLEALGIKYYDEKKTLIEKITPSKFKDIRYIDDTKLCKNIKNVRFTILSDVKNPLLGYEGATYIYGPQKGLQKDEMKETEEKVKFFSELIENKINEKTSIIAGAGCAGGVGFACLSYLSDKIYSGIEYLLESYDFDNLIKEYDYVITGEGALDKQSLYGKVVSVITKKTIENNKKVIIITGNNKLDETDVKDLKVEHIFSIVPDVATIKESLANPKQVFEKFIDRIKWKSIIK
ncbi:MAG: glycerate kinase [Bacilli bacterium]|jgi:glycerate kinase